MSDSVLKQKFNQPLLETASHCLSVNTGQILGVLYMASLRCIYCMMVLPGAGKLGLSKVGLGKLGFGKVGRWFCARR